MLTRQPGMHASHAYPRCKGGPNQLCLLGPRLVVRAAPNQGPRLVFYTNLKKPLKPTKKKQTFLKKSNYACAKTNNKGRNLPVYKNFKGGTLAEKSLFKVLV
jgi:hypothetical protein